MIENLVRSIESVFVEFTAKRFLYLLFVLLLVVAGPLTFDRATDWSFQRRMTGRIDALERLRALELGGIKESTDLSSVYSNLVRQLAPAPPGALSAAVLPSGPRERFFKILAGSWIALLFTLWGLIQMVSRQPDGFSLFGGALLFVILFAIPSYFVPTIGSLGLTITAMTVVQFALVVTFTKRWSKVPPFARAG